jgi:hypothetical protein
VSASTEQTSASAQEISASANELAATADRMRSLVGHFVLNLDLDNRSTLADQFDDALEAHRAWDARLREALDTATSSVPVDQARRDDCCTFGKWLHTTSEFRAADPGIWQQLHDLHEQFHHHAADVLELALAGDRAKAQQRMQNEAFTATRRRLQDTLATAARSSTAAQTLQQT